jgi:PAS domain S-box-containing protein
VPPQTIPDRSNVTERLRWEGEMFRLLAENVKDYAIFIIDEQRHITTWTVGAEHLLGYTEAEIVGRQLDVFFTPEDLAVSAPETEIRTALKVGRGEDDRWHVRKDGTRFWCSGVLTPLRDESGRLRGFAKIMRDLTEKKLAEDRLAASEDRFKRLVRANILGVAVTGADGRVLDANDEYLRIIGYTREELEAGKVLRAKLTPPEYLPLDEAAIAQALRDGACVPYQKEYQRSDGRRTPVQIAFMSVADPPKSFVVYVTDLSSVKHVEDELRLANRNKDEFLAVLGHELRNPLAPMLNAVHVLRNAKLIEDEGVANQSMHMIERQVLHMTRLVNDLLEVARVTMGKVDLKPLALELHPVVMSAIEAVRPAMEGSRHQLHVSVAAEPIWLHADSVRVEQMLTNLLNNAVKYTDPGGSIWLDIQRQAQMVVFTVRDSGIGIEADALARVFEPFTQVKRGQSYSKGGLGVGLMLVRRFAELHGGTVSAHSAGPGTGSTFTVKLPVMTEAPAARPDARVSEQSSSRVRVLVVDDNTDAADSLRMVLEVSGHDVHVAYTGPAGLEEAKAWRPEVVLLDIGLPGLNGYEVAKAIRREPQMQGTLLVAITGYGQPADVEQAYAAGFDKHHAKPVEPAKVFELLSLASQGRAGTLSHI